MSDRELLDGNCIVERGRVNGAALSGRRFLAPAGQVIASRIYARNGAMGLVPPAVDGALVTNHFPLFGLDEQRLRTGMEFSYRRLTKLRTGNFLYPKLMAWESTLGVVPPACDGCLFSIQFPVFGGL